MKYLILAMFIVISPLAFSADFSVELKPKEPVAGEVFQMNITIETTSKVEPYISFDPGKAEVQERRNIGTSVQTTIINGVVETKRVTRYAYDLIVNDPGRLIIREIKVDIDGETLEHERIEANVLRERKDPKKYFLRAETSKEKLYLGEGTTVNYYLYFRVPVLGTEIRDFPKLNNFIKRFHMPPEQVETIEEGGVLYRRKLVYSARIYPEEIGSLEIDPLKIRLQYSMESNNSSPFSGFGFSSRQNQVRNTQSAPVDVEVLPLPLEGMPKNFTGLVGEHDVNLNMRKERYLVNEPIEVMLEVSGPGALENLSAPALLSSSSLENFDTESEFEELDKKTAKKTFDYTYLARAPFSLKERNFEFSYFDPEEKEYKSKTVRIPAVTVSGGGSKLSNDKEVSAKQKEVSTPTKANVKDLELRLMAPYWSSSTIEKLVRYPFYYLNLLLILFVLICVVWLGLDVARKMNVENELEQYVHDMRRNGITYSRVFNLFDTYRLAIGEDRKKMDEIVDELKLNETEKKYFKSLLIQAEKESFKDSKEVLNLKFNKRYFDKLVNHLQQAINESHSKT